MQRIAAGTSSTISWLRAEEHADRQHEAELPELDEQPLVLMHQPEQAGAGGNERENELDYVRPPDMQLTEYTGFAIKQLKRFAKRYRVHVICVAHPPRSRAARGVASSRVPALYDIADSAHSPTSLRRHHHSPP